MNELLILQISTELTTADALLFSSIIVAVLFASVKLRSLVSMTLWVFLVVSFIGVIRFDMDIINFWIILILTGIGLVISMVAYTFGESNI